MNVLHRIVRVLVLALLFAAGLGLLASSWSRGQWADTLGVAAQSRADAIYGGVALTCLALLYLLTGLRRGQRERFLSFSNEGGAVSMSTQAVADYIMKLAGEFPSVIRMRPRIKPARGKIDIVVDLRVKAGPQIHEICELLQQRVRESVTTGLGISEVRRVEVSVREIVSEHRPERG